ncbi:very short patch repair endonuclease [Phycicoccus sp. Soil748]|uniref:very short patch repair endonuclease n=1 Tax=Phycicoccus sp. Soil748 TaxID=1736397 RepID=UPI0009EB9754|nr:very short patch repair endonuclease [Phycicoccus sp. Soil748]
MPESASWASSPAVRATMRANKGRDTGPELAIRRLLHARGRRYFVNRRPVKQLRRTADIVFPRYRVAVFVDGCFWHGCPIHHNASKTNAEYWAKKVDNNRARDLETVRALEAAGWRVLRIWEHETPAHAVASIERALAQAEAENTGSRMS